MLGRLLGLSPGRHRLSLTLPRSRSLALAFFLSLPFPVLLPCISLVPAFLSPSLFCVLVPWPQSTPPTHTLVCRGLFRASLWSGRKLPSPGPPGATSAPPPGVSQAAEAQPRQ